MTTMTTLNTANLRMSSIQ